MNKVHFYQILYNILLYLFFLIASPFFLFKVLTQKKYRTGLLEKLGFLSNSLKNSLRTDHLIWVHAVSVGEVHAAIPLLEKLQDSYKDKKFILSTTTVTGQNVARKWINGNNRITLIYFPLDFASSFRSIFRHGSIDMIIIMETEIWPNFLIEAYKHSIPVILVNGRISDNSFKNYRLIKKMFVASTGSIKCFCMQDEEDAKKLIALGIDKTRIIVTGNIKYEASLNTPVKHDISQKLLKNLNWKKTDPVWVAGSTHDGEENIICDIYKTLKKETENLKLILAPRHPERISQVEKILQDKKIPFIKKTDLDKKTASPKTTDLLLLDTMGELRHLYAIATVVFIGKSLFPGGGQNILEPASQGKPVVFGKYMDNFSKITEIMLSANAAVQIGNKEDLLTTIKTLLKDKSKRDIIGKNAIKIIKVYADVTDKILVQTDSFIQNLKS